MKYGDTLLVQILILLSPVDAVFHENMTVLFSKLFHHRQSPLQAFGVDPGLQKPFLLHSCFPVRSRCRYISK